MRTVKNKATEKTTKEEREKTKKPFDKKRYRLKKYSNKYKVNQWEERRKKAVLRKYYKDVKKDEINSEKKSALVKDAPETNEGKSQPEKKRNAFFAAKKEFQWKRDEKKRIKEEKLRAKAEKEEALRKYKEKRMQTYKKLSKLTRRGQPVMKDRLEMLFEKIQQTN